MARALLRVQRGQKRWGRCCTVCVACGGREFFLALGGGGGRCCTVHIARGGMDFFPWRWGGGGACCTVCRGHGGKNFFSGVGLEVGPVIQFTWGAVARWRGFFP
jgi:hypothetical protein